MSFLKSFFDDDSKIIGLCGFKSERNKKKYSTKIIEPDLFFNPFQTEKAYETNYSNNLLLF